MRAQRGRSGAPNTSMPGTSAASNALARHVNLRRAFGACVLTRGVADHREGAAHGPERASQRQFARELAMLERLGRNLPARRQNTQRDGQIEAPRLLRQIGGCEIDGDFADGKIEAAVLQRGAHALTVFADFEIGQADDEKRRQPVGEMDFDDDFQRAPRRGCAAAYHGKRHDFTRSGAARTPRRQ